MGEVVTTLTAKACVPVEVAVRLSIVHRAADQLVEDLTDSVVQGSRGRGRDSEQSDVCRQEMAWVRHVVVRGEKSVDKHHNERIGRHRGCVVVCVRCTVCIHGRRGRRRTERESVESVKLNLRP